MLLPMLLLLPLLERGAAQESRTCTSIRPCFIGTINSAVPDGVAQFSSNSGFSACSADSASYESGEKDVTTAYKDWQEAGGLAVSVDTVIEFDNIPDDAYGCELFLTFVGGYDKIHSFEGLPAKFDVWHVDKSVEGNLTWNNAPKSTALLDVVTDLKLPEEGDDFPAYFSEETRKIGQGDTSKKCGSKMTFRISVPTWIKKGGVEFRQELSPFGGWMLQYNC